ncbi:MAG: hypothetical protein J3R72DRAFT_486972 [Linnemannia gamsii]|nr:MAG: hypothetical protein J3R72DRAFT_486972 [Linnemannia gamsii]
MSGRILYSETKTQASKNKEAAGYLSSSDAAAISLYPTRDNYTVYSNAMFCTRRGLFIDLLSGHNGYSDKKVSIVSDDRSTRYKFKVSMQTNGYVIKRLAFDTIERQFRLCNRDSNKLPAKVAPWMMICNYFTMMGKMEELRVKTKIHSLTMLVVTFRRSGPDGPLAQNYFQMYRRPFPLRLYYPDPGSAFVVGWDARESNSGMASSKNPLDPTRNTPSKSRESFFGILRSSSGKLSNEERRRNRSGLNCAPVVILQS